jgi:secreted Zn-dependent insulinase-like peptidase
MCVTVAVFMCAFLFAHFFHSFQIMFFIGLMQDKMNKLIVLFWTCVWNVLFCLFCSPYAYIDPLHASMNTMFVELFRDALNEYAYAAEIAGLGYNLAYSCYGITVRNS